MKNTPSKPDVMELITCITQELDERVQESDRSGYKNSEDMFDERLYDERASAETPSLEVLRAFVTKVFKEAEVGEEVIVMAYVYLDRLTSVSSIRLASTNWKLLVLSCFMLASKGVLEKKDASSKKKIHLFFFFCFSFKSGKRKQFGTRTF